MPCLRWIVEGQNELREEVKASRGAGTIAGTSSGHSCPAFDGLNNREERKRVDARIAQPHSFA
jgi:hypothetical protein